MAGQCQKYQICMQDKLHAGQYSLFPIVAIVWWWHSDFFARGGTKHINALLCFVCSLSLPSSSTVSPPIAICTYSLRWWVALASSHSFGSILAIVWWWCSNFFAKGETKHINALVWLVCSLLLPSSSTAFAPITIRPSSLRWWGSYHLSTFVWLHCCHHLMMTLQFFCERGHKTHQRPPLLCLLPVASLLVHCITPHHDLHLLLKKMGSTCLSPFVWLHPCHCLMLCNWKYFGTYLGSLHISRDLVMCKVNKCFDLVMRKVNKYFGTYLGYLATISMSPQCDTFQLMPVSF